MKVSDVRRYLNELRLVEVVSVSVDALSQLSVELLQRLHLSTVSFNHGSAQEVLMTHRNHHANNNNTRSSEYDRETTLQV